MSGVDYDPVVVCPYDGNHKVAKSRIQRHLVKCEKNFPPNFKKQCPYDATHRLFEYELIEHVKNCPMKHTCPLDIGPDRQGSSYMAEEIIEARVDDNQESWDQDLLDDSTASERSEMVSAKQYGNKLRRPFGYSESLMLDTSSLSADEGAPSVTSDMGIGRGRSIPVAYSEQNKRGTQVFGKKGIRGRLLP